MFSQFRAQYPTGSLISELLEIHAENYIVRALVQMGGQTLATGMAAATTIEQAEDQARLRALAILGFGGTPQAIAPEVVSPQVVTPPSTPEVVSPQVVTPPSEVIAHPPAKTSKQKPSVTRESTLNLSPATPIPTEPEPISEPQPESLPVFREAEPTPKSVFTPEFTLTNPVETPPERDLKGTENLPFSDHPEADSQEYSVAASEFSIPVNVESSNGSEAGHSPLITPPDLEDPDNDSFDFPGVSMKVGLEIKRINWTPEQEADYLKFAYGKQSRSLLSNAQLLEFLHYLQTFAQTTLELQRVGWDDQQGSSYLKKTYPKSKGSRRRLTYADIQDFYVYLQTLASANDSLY